MVSTIDTLKEWYFSTLIICFVGVIGCYSGYAYLQEELLADKSLMINVNFVLAVQSFMGILLSSAIIKLCGMGSLFGELHKGDLWVGILNFTTMYCSNTALKYVSFPFMVLSKSAKILPVVFTGWLQGVYKLSLV